MISSGVVEGFSGKAKLTGRKAYGLRTPQGIEIALFHPMRNPTRAENIPQILLEEGFFRGQFQPLGKGHQNCKSRDC